MWSFKTALVACAAALALLASGAHAQYTVQWCIEPKVNNRPVKTLTVPCGSKVTFDWSCEDRLYDLVEISAYGDDACKVPVFETGVSDNMPLNIDGRKTITMNVNTRRFKCSSFCYVGQYFTVNANCGVAPLRLPDPSPVPSPRAIAPKPATPAPAPTTPTTTKKTKKTTKKNKNKKTSKSPSPTRGL